MIVDGFEVAMNRLGQFIVGWLNEQTGGIAVPFSLLGAGLLVGAALCFLLPKARVRVAASTP